MLYRLSSPLVRIHLPSRRGCILALLVLFGAYLISMSTPTIRSVHLSLMTTIKYDVVVSTETDTPDHQRYNSDSKTNTKTMGNEGSSFSHASMKPNNYSSFLPHHLGRSERISSYISKGSNDENSSRELQDFQYTHAQQCRLELEQWLNPQIDEFLQMGEAMPPMIDWVWDMGQYFLINIKFHRIFLWNHNAFFQATWNWQDQFGNNFTIDGMWGQRRAYGVILPHFKVPSLQVTNQTERSVPVFLWASNVKVPENKTVQHWVYDLRPYLECDRIETEIDRPPPGTKIGMCVRFRGSHHLIPPFIAYHRLIGVEHFWFYVNEEFDISDLPVAPYLTYVPYRFVWEEHKNYSRQVGKDGIERPWNLEYNGDNFWQVEAMQQCLYRLKRYGLEWLMTNDIDEYLWLNETESMGVNKSIGNTSILQEFLLKYETDDPNIGGLAVEGWSFGANENEIGILRELQIDYIYRVNEVSGGRRKIIYRVPTAKRISVHWLFEGGYLLELPISTIRWNHYREPHTGVYGRKNNFWLVCDSSLPDAYRPSIVQALNGFVYHNRTKVMTTRSAMNSTGQEECLPNRTLCQCQQFW